MTNNEQIEKAAEKHADELRVSSSIPGALVPLLHDIAKSSYIYGAQDALASQWVSVEDALPEPMQRVLVWIGDEALVCWYTKSGRFKTTLRSQERYSKDKSLDVKIHLSPCREDVTDIATHWCAIPQLNPEKEER